jgi:hypothetical protein
MKAHGLIALCPEGGRRSGRQNLTPITHYIYDQHAFHVHQQKMEPSQGIDSAPKCVGGLVGGEELTRKG